MRVLEVSPLPPTLESLGLAGTTGQLHWGPRPARRAASSSADPRAAASRPRCTPRSSSSRGRSGRSTRSRTPSSESSRASSRARSCRGDPPHLRPLAARPGPGRPRRHHGRRGPRRRDGQDGGRLGGHRTPRVHDPAHQRRLGSGQPPGRDGRTPLSGGCGVALLRRPAARPPALPHTVAPRRP